MMFEFMDARDRMIDCELFNESKARPLMFDYGPKNEMKITSALVSGREHDARAALSSSVSERFSTRLAQTTSASVIIVAPHISPNDGFELMAPAVDPDAALSQ